MDFVDEIEARKKLIGAMINSMLLFAVTLALDTLILWFVWDNIMIPVFHVPAVSTWQALGLLYGYRILNRKRNS